MDKPQFRFLSHPELENPVFVEGLPGFGDVGKGAAQLLIEFAEAKPFAELYAPSFPDYVVVNQNGICRPPRYQFYSAKTEKRHFIILLGDAQPSLEDVVVHYDLCGEILDFVEKLGCKFVVTMGGAPSPRPVEEVYVAASSKKLAVEAMEKGGILYGKGRIVGATGLLLGLAKKRGINGICLLGATTGLKTDRRAAFSVFKLLMKSLGIDVRPETLKRLGRKH